MKKTKLLKYKLHLILSKQIQLDQWRNYIYKLYFCNVWRKYKSYQKD